MGKYEKQQGFLRGCISAKNVKRHRLSNDENDFKRTMTYEYRVQKRNRKLIQICKSSFLLIFGITKKRTALLYKKVNCGIIDVSDQRGGYRNIAKSSEWIQKIIEFIASFPAEQGHYNREDSPNVKYLSEDLNISKLFLLFQKKYYDNETQKIHQLPADGFIQFFGKISICLLEDLEQTHVVHVMN